MTDPKPASPDAEAARGFLAFRVADRLYALPAEEVLEVVHLPPVARVPQAPDGLLGVANLRGAVLPVASLRGLLGLAEGEATASARAIVLDGAAPVALAVDAVDALVAVEQGRVETRQAELATEEGEKLQGAFRLGDDGELARILDIRSLLNAAFVQRPRARLAGDAGGEAQPAAEEDAEAGELLVVFEVAGQEYALALDTVQEIAPAPESRVSVPRAEALVLGVTSFRDRLLPLLSLRGLLGVTAPAASDAREKVIVTSVQGLLVGLVADRMPSIVTAEPGHVEPTPAMLAARTAGEAKIQAIYRGEGGRRLISILAPSRLFREDVMQRLGAEDAASPAQEGAADERAEEELQFLVFRLGEEEFALPIEAVDEVALVPAQITRVPKTPEFLEGVVNLRGEVVPVVDQRRRFDMPPLEDAGRRRLVVVRSERHRAGLIVDGVSDVLRSTADAVGPAPDLTGEETRLVCGIVNVEDTGRLVMLLDPAELLSRAERGLLDSFEAVAGQSPS